MAVVRRDPANIPGIERVRGSAHREVLRRCPPPDQVLVRDIEEVGLVARQFQPPLRVAPTVALDAVGIQDGLDFAGIAEPRHAPLRLLEFLHAARQCERPGLSRVHDIVPVGVTSNAALFLARHEVGEGPHALDGHAVLVKGQEIDRLPCRNLEEGRSVFFNGGEPPDLLRRIRCTGADHGKLKAESATFGIDPQRLLDLLDDCQLLDGTALDAGGKPVVYIHHADFGPFDVLFLAAVVREARRHELLPGSCAHRLRRVEAKPLCISFDKLRDVGAFIFAELNGSILGNEITFPIQWIRIQVGAADVVAGAFVNKPDIDFRRQVPDRLLRIPADRGVNDADCPVTMAVVGGHHAEDLAFGSGDLAGVHECGWGENAVAEQTGEVGPVRVDRPQALDRNGRPVDVFPTAVENATVCHHGRREIVEVVGTEPHRPISVGLALEQDGGGGPPAIGKCRLAIGEKDNLIVWQPAGVEVVGGVVRDLLQARSIRAHRVELEGARHITLPAEENRLTIIVQVGVQNETLIACQYFPQSPRFGAEDEKAPARSVVFLVVGVNV